MAQDGKRATSSAAVDKLMQKLGVQFNDPTLLQSALTHRSYVHEHYQTSLPPNERLEFLGDSVLNFITAHYLYHAFPNHGEGQLTALRAVLVRTKTLAAFARKLDLGKYLKLGKGEEHSGGRERDNLLADTFEAVVAAIYLDQGLEAAEQFLVPLIKGQSLELLDQQLLLDDKSRLQERVQAERNLTPRYRTLSVTGPDHHRVFIIEVTAGEERLGVGEGNNKQAAAQAAARAALQYLDQLEADKST
jgi:ribonuclease-3